MPLKDLNRIDPYSIRDTDCPVFVQSANIHSIFGFGISKRIKSLWQHSMIMRKQGFVCTQGWTYKEIDISAYMKPGSIMKFWICKDITDEERNAIMIKIYNDLRKKWWKKMYDVPGILGQLFGIRWFNIPGLNYCSERTSSKDRVVVPNIKKHQEPEDRDTSFKESNRMSVLGYYFFGE